MLYKKMDTLSNEESQHEKEDWLGSDDIMHESKGIAAGLKALLVRLLGALFIIDGRRGTHAPDFDFLLCAPSFLDNVSLDSNTVNRLGRRNYKGRASTMPQAKCSSVWQNTVLCSPSH
jgi:hypothetical protein